MEIYSVGVESLKFRAKNSALILHWHAFRPVLQYRFDRISKKKISVLLQQNTNSHWIGSVLYIAKWTKVSNDVLYVHHLLNSWEKCVQISSYILPPNEIQSEWKLYFRNRKDSSGQVYLNGS